jgi:ATP-dependent protease ClpP protease subunit
MENDEILYENTIFLTERKYSQSVFTLSITEIIGPESYFNLFESLRSASDIDILEIRLSSGGGRLDSGMILYNIIKERFKGRTTAFIDSNAASMAGLIFLSADRRVIYPHSVLMIHDMSLGLHGKANEILGHINAYKESYETLYHKLCENILTEEEKSHIEHGRDLYLSATDMCRRKIADIVIVDGEECTAEEYLTLSDKTKEAKKDTSKKNKKN